MLNTALGLGVLMKFGDFPAGCGGSRVCILIWSGGNGDHEFIIATLLSCSSLQK